MADKSGQYSLDDYRFPQVEVRLKLMEGPSYYSNEPLDNPDAAVQVMADVLKDLDREWVCTILLDTKLRPVSWTVISIGSINQSLAPIHNIFKAAILSNSAYIILMHTHPSGDPAPSEQDIELTKKVVLAGKLMNIEMIDHVILGSETGDICSMRSLFPELIKAPYEQKAAEELVSQGIRKKKVKER